MKIYWTHAHAVAMRQRYIQLHTRIQQLPHPGSRPVTIAGRFAGWMTAQAVQGIHGLGCVRVAAQAVHVGRADASTAALDHDLAHVAQALRDAGCLNGWRDELLDVFAEGQAIAVMERTALRPLGLLTRAVHLNAWTPAGDFWAAQRAQTKATDPGLWDTLVGGLCAAGETLQDSLLRESDEEAGLAAADLVACTALRTIARIHKRLPEGMQVEDVVVGECVLSDAVTPANRDGEVSCIRALSPETLWRMIRDDAFTTEAELVILHCLLGRIDKGIP